ncbi:unnamed protein product [Brachionus calyciflorus]|uniref:SH3 domain-containing protein n=1 Tax=Brachionus calyciflorus TaxID=104777 RepID=A0A814EU82_9BILA|nr:unnamed protein product [Brachionus calyciflorus]
MQLQGDLNSNFEHIKTILDKDLQENSKQLSDNVLNLERVAQYCEDIYVNSKEGDKQHLLNETRSYTAQALASVAYQIHVLSNSFLALLDTQGSVLDEMGVSIHHLAHEVNIHKEKVARREIGVLTTNKCIVRTGKVKRPDVEEKPVKYVRKPIDFSILDDVGHGVKINRQQDLSKIGVGRQNSYSSTHSTNSTNTKIADVTNTPPLILKSNALMNVNSSNGMGTVRSTNSNSIYRTPVIPPSVPTEYLSRQELGIYSSKKELNQSAGAESLSGAYGGMSYRRPSQNTSINQGQSEYSDTINSRTGNAYLQQLNNFPPNNNNNNSVGYSSGKDLGIIRTNLNNIDYATNGTIYRRPQLHSSIYERSISNSSQGENSQYGQGVKNQVFNRQDSQKSNQIANQSILSNASSIHGLPPPPVLFSGLRSNPDSSSINNGEINFGNVVFENEFMVGNNEFDDDEDDDFIPNWVPMERCLEKVITLFDYEGLRDDELTFKENMYIYVIKKNDDHWYEGIMKTENGDIVQGLYPYNYARCVKRFVEDSRVTQC